MSLSERNPYEVHAELVQRVERLEAQASGVDVERARTALARLYEWHAEFHVPEIFSDGNEMYTPGDEDAPFFSEAYLYTLLGKEDARSLLSRMRELAQALGVGALR